MEKKRVKRHNARKTVHVGRLTWRMIGTQQRLHLVTHRCRTRTQSRPSRKSLARAGGDCTGTHRRRACEPGGVLSTMRAGHCWKYSSRLPGQRPAAPARRITIAARFVPAWARWPHPVALPLSHPRRRRPVEPGLLSPGPPFDHRQHIAVLCVKVKIHLIHEPAHKVQAQPAFRQVFQVSTDRRFWHRRGVKRLAVIMN